MVFDWKNNREEALRNGIEERDLFVIEPTMTVEDGVVKQHIFRNFDTLTFDKNVEIENCVFENCKDVTIDNCQVNDCEFLNSGIIFFRDTIVLKSTFKDSVSDTDTLISLEDSKLCDCTFQNIKLLNDSYLCDGVGDSWIESSGFINISTGRKDGEIINCEETVGKLFKKTKKFCIIDESSCKGLDQVKNVCSNNSYAKSEPDVFCQRIEKGLLTKEKAEELKKYQVNCDMSCYDEDVINKTIARMNFNVPTFNCLTRAGFKTIGELISLDVVQILEIKNIGNSSIIEVANKLSELGIANTAWNCFA